MYKLPCFSSNQRSRRVSVAKHIPPARNDVSELQEMLRGAGLRSTAARMSVLQMLRKAKSPMSHAELAAELMPLGFDKATIFRNLADLSDAGLVLRHELGDHVWRFELLDPQHAENGAHPHFVCVECGNVTCLGSLNLTPKLKTVNDQIGRVTEVLLRGHCKNCD